MPLRAPHLVSFGFLPALKIVLLDVRPLLLFRIPLPGLIRLLERTLICLLARVVLGCFLAHGISFENQSSEHRKVPRQEDREKGPRLARPQSTAGRGGAYFFMSSFFIPSFDIPFLDVPLLVPVVSLPMEPFFIPALSALFIPGLSILS